ncbi:ATP-binding cassette domain-containing protein [Halovenus sp. WSH3]|uniref:Molybdate/tungstate import ATP-binding protein WtpC n=1 Tax=Halovenus carboxidivorans TaxID=2692199 RepID=A0A6B0T2X1_9EURY|nr:ABC transporter ATP-binding protein [Halovenus carboxidivorans]MXR52355.1 ATP-binding cassette domain-containing protein [Halovenus carboxidivorans]
MSGQKLDERVQTGQPAIGWHDEREETTDAETVLELDGLTRRYGIETAVEDFSLSVGQGELLTLLGPSGCGKTTTLRMIAGLEQPSSGSIRIGGETVADGSTATPPEERDVGLVFQEFALFPHLTVGENITFGIDDWEQERQQERLAELLALVDLEEHEDKYPDALSGGQQQRVALARSLAPEPDILLLDEPFSNLDVRLRIDMRQEVRRILKEAGVTAISVTHDQEEALSISDRVAIMSDGHLEQVGKPELVFENPESRFVASFLGRASFLTGRVRGETVETELEQLETAQLNGPVDAYDGAQIDILVRPDDLEAVPATDGSADGEVVHRQYNGPNFVYGVELTDGTTLRCLHNHVEVFEHGQPVEVSITADHDLAWYPTEETDI